MKIAIVLPVPQWKIIGGYKVVYEYTNYIVSQGHDVTIFYNAHEGENNKGIPSLIAYLLRYFVGKFGPHWFCLNHQIHKSVCYTYKGQAFKGFDIIVATAAETAKYVNDSSVKKKFYFVQDYENWNGRTDKMVNQTFRMNFNIITISKWLQRKIKETSGKVATYIPNGINKDIFFERNNFEKRGKHTLSFLFHDDLRKGCDIAVKIVYRLKKKYSDFEAYVFGYPPRPKEWPNWIHYERKATSQQVSQVMNSTRVFLCTSRQEGFGLTGLESLFCGCVLVTTDCLGIHEYATNDNAYICPIDDEEKLFLSVCKAFDNQEQTSIKREYARQIFNFFDLDVSKKLFLQTLIGKAKSEDC